MTESAPAAALLVSVDEQIDRQFSVSETGPTRPQRLVSTRGARDQRPSTTMVQARRCAETNRVRTAAHV